MRDQERGSTLLSVLASVLILTVMLTALMSVSAREIGDMNRSVAVAGNLDDLRGALQAIDFQFTQKWSEMVPAGQVADLKTAENDLNQSSNGAMDDSVLGKVNAWCSKAFQGTSITPAITYGNNNFAEVESAFGPATDLYQNYAVTLTSTKRGISQTLTDTITISGAVQSLNYSVYTPWAQGEPENAGNITILGAPEIDGDVAAGNALYVDPVPWQGTALDSQSKAYITIPDPTSLVPQPYRFWPEPGSCEPMVLPKITTTAGISTRNGIHSFTSYSDQDWLHLFGTDQLGNSSYLSDASKALTGSNIGQYLDGTLSTSPSFPNLPADYVTEILKQVEPSIKKQAKEINNDGYGQYKKTNQISGYVHLEGGKVPVVTEGVQQVTGPLYVDGDLTIDTSSELHLNRPLYVAGNLVIKGTLDSSAAIYVGGTTTITNAPVDKPGVTPPRLEVFSGGDIALSFSTHWFGPTASSPTTLHAFLASGSNVYIEGMTSFYKVIGGVCGQNVILNATVGAQQLFLGPWLYAVNANDHTRRLTIQYDNSYISNPLTGTPTLGTMQVQNLPLPYVSSP